MHSALLEYQKTFEHFQNTLKSTKFHLAQLDVLVNAYLHVLFFIHFCFNF